MTESQLISKLTDIEWEDFPEFDYSSGFRPPINSGFQLKIVKK